MASNPVSANNKIVFNRRTVDRPTGTTFNNHQKRQNDGSLTGVLGQVVSGSEEKKESSSNAGTNTNATTGATSATASDDDEDDKKKEKIPAVAASQTTPQKNATVDKGTTTDKPATTTANVTGPVIDFLLSNTWNSSQYLAQSNPKIQFVYNGNFTVGGQNSTATQPTIVTIDVKERRQYQKMMGLGAGITDASAIVLQALKANRPDAYEEILNLCFNESPEWIAKGGAGMNMIRLPIGASDFGFQEYTYDDTVDGSPDPTLARFDIEKSPKRWQTVQDILKINPKLIVMASPWSPPAWIKGQKNGSLHGGSVLKQYEGVFGDYLVKFVKTLKESKGINVNVLSLQNEPLYDGAKYPCSKMEPEQQARIGTLTRKKLDAAGFNKVKILAYDHNWDNSDYPIKVFDDAAESFAGAAWHCYGGEPSGQDPFNEAYPDRWVWFTECTRITQYYDEPWENVKKQFDQILKGSISYNSQAVILWNLALQIDKEGFTVPSLPQTCKNCLAPIVVYDNSTGPQLDGINRTAIDSQKTNKRGLSGPTLNNDDDLFEMFSKRADTQPLGVLQNAGHLSDSKAINKGADNEGAVIPPTRDTNYRTSDYVTLAHLGVAIRPQKDGERWAQRVGVVTSEDDNSGPIAKAQLFRNSLGNGTSRWSVLILQQYDHYGYDRAKAEDITFQLKFRDYVASFVLPPGAFTLQWTAKDTDFERQGDQVKASSSLRAQHRS